MTTNLKSELKKMSEVDFICLEYHFALSRMVRNIMKETGWDENKMAEKLHVKSSQMKSILNAAYEFDLRMLSTIQSIQMQLATEAAKERIDMQVDFKQYKYQWPIMQERIEKLITKIEKQQSPTTADAGKKE